MIFNQSLNALIDLYDTSWLSHSWIIFEKENFLLSMVYTLQFDVFSSLFRWNRVVPHAQQLRLQLSSRLRVVADARGQKGRN